MSCFFHKVTDSVSQHLQSHWKHIFPSDYRNWNKPVLFGDGRLLMNSTYYKQPKTCVSVLINNSVSRTWWCRHVKYEFALPQNVCFYNILLNSNVINNGDLILRHFVMKKTFSCSTFKWLVWNLHKKMRFRHLKIESCVFRTKPTWNFSN